MKVIIKKAKESHIDIDDLTNSHIIFKIFNNSIFKLVTFDNQHFWFDIFDNVNNDAKHYSSGTIQRAVKVCLDKDIDVYAFSDINSAKIFLRNLQCYINFI